MTYSVSKVSRPTLADRVAHYAADIKARAQSYAVYRQTLRELEAMTDRDLADIGIARGQIKDIAAEAAMAQAR